MKKEDKFEIIRRVISMRARYGGGEGTTLNADMSGYKAADRYVELAFKRLRRDGEAEMGLNLRRFWTTGIIW